MLETLEPLSADRKCFRLINGVLVERTVKDVVPALKTNQEGLKKVLDDLVKQYKTKQEELDKWKVSLLRSPFKTPFSHSLWSRFLFLITNKLCRRSTMFKWCGNRHNF